MPEVKTRLNNSLSEHQHNEVGNYTTSTPCAAIHRFPSVF